MQGPPQFHLFGVVCAWKTTTRISRGGFTPDGGGFARPRPTDPPTRRRHRPANPIGEDPGGEEVRVTRRQGERGCGGGGGGG